jgi:holliday junction DNA helicase RuvB
MSMKIEYAEDNELRPTGFSGYIGQEAVKEVLEVSMEAAQERKEPLEHTLIWGPPGYGKTTLANIMATEMQARIIQLLGGNLKSTKDVVPVFDALGRGTNIFIDEIHRMWSPAQEVLYPPMEDRILNQKFGNIMVTTDLPAFTLIGATTIPEKLAQPFIDRFGLKLELVPYSLGELSQIVRNSADRLNLTIDEEAIMEVATRCKGTPRVANTMLRRLRDFAQYHEVEELDAEFVDTILKKKGLKWNVA